MIVGMSSGLVLRSTSFNCFKFGLDKVTYFDLSVSHLDSKPLVSQKLGLVAGLNILDKDGTQEPGSVVSFTAVVVPDTQILERSKRSKVTLILKSLLHIIL